MMEADEGSCYYTRQREFLPPPYPAARFTMRHSLAVLSVLFIAPVFAEEPKNWPQWRGPSGQGRVNDPRVPLEWSESKNLLWKVKLPGAGHSTPVVWGD